jgi:hypothetical protein
VAAAGRGGRRHNGLDAADWRAITDLDPRVSEEALAVLASARIAAYVQPAMDVDPITRSTTLPSRPTDRLYVDRSQVDAARDRLRQWFAPGSPAAPPAEASGPDSDATNVAGSHPGVAGSHPSVAGSHPSFTGSDPSFTTSHPSFTGSDRSFAGVDATFAGIVAGFDRPVDPTAAGWPAAENLPGPAAGSGAPESATGTGALEPAPDDRQPPPPERRPAGLVDARSVTEPSLLDGLDQFGADLPDEPAERFIPPPPPPLPRLSRQTVLGGLAIMAGLVLLLGQPAVLALEPGTAMLLGFAAVLGGAVALILRLRPGTDPEDPPTDDGAQV